VWKADLYSGEFLFLPRHERLKYTLDLLRTVFKKIKSEMQSTSVKLKREHTLARMLAEIEEANARAERAYVAKPYPGRITLFWCSDWSFRVFHDTRLGWSDVADGGLEVHTVPGNHKTMWELPNVGTLADKMKRCLRIAHDIVA
jgi:thioesterase domain-containing protein